MIILNSIFLKIFYPNASFGSKVQVIGIKGVSIGDGTCIGDQSWLNVAIRDKNKRMNIGGNVLIGRHAVITTAEYLEIGDFCVLSPRVYISETDHVFNDLSKPILEQGVVKGKKVIIEENCWLGINSVIVGDLVIGRGSVVAANSVVKSTVPPFSVVAGSPARIVKMYNPKTENWERVKDEDDVKRIERERKDFEIPSRIDYKEILYSNCKMKRVHPILAGRGISV